MKNLERCRKQSKTSYRDPDSEETLEVFHAATDYEMFCDNITGRRFETVDDHTKFIKNGGCNKLINALAKV